MLNNEKHIELLKQVPFECFYYAKHIIERIKNNQNVSTNDIVYCYTDIARSLTNDQSLRQPVFVPNVSDIGNCYKFLDYINPHLNHIYGYIFKSNLLLPKVYKNAIVNKTPSNIPVFCKPKIAVNREAMNNYKNKFTRIAIINREVYTDQYLADCYDALKDLMAIADFIPNKKFGNNAGSAVLRKELIDLFYNQNIIRDASILAHYSTHKRENIVTDIIQHKQAMFGELQR